MLQIHTKTVGEAKKQGIRTLSWALPLLFSLLPIALLSVYCYQIASNSVRDILLAQDLSETSNISMLLQQDMTKTVALAEAFASAQGTVRLLEQEDTLGMVTRLKALTLSFPALKSAMIAGGDNNTSYAYPPDANLKDTSKIFLESVRVQGKPSISPVTSASSGGTVIIAAPIMMSGGTYGTLGLEYRTNQIQTWLENIDLPTGSLLSVIDRNSIVVASTDKESIGTSYGDIKEIDFALQGTLTTAEFNDKRMNEPVVATLLPVNVGHDIWVIIAQKTKKVAYHDLQKVRANIAVAGGALTLITLIMVITIANTQSKNARLARELQEKNLQLNETAAIVQTSNDAIVGFGRDGRIRTWNAAAQKMYGWKAGDMLGESIRKIIPQNQSDTFAELLTKVTGGDTIQNIETIHAKADGTPIPVSITLSPIRDEQGNVVAISSIDRDITEVKKIEQMKDDFISFVSHQLKAPITAIRWTLESVMDGDYGTVPDGLKKPIEEMQDVNAHNYHLISDILNASRIDRGVIAVESKAISLHDITERSLRDYRIAIQKAGLSLTLENGAGNLMVLADLEKTAEAITNSLSNAIKHTSSGGITIRTYKEEGFGCIDVTDTGEGMPSYIIEKLFTRTGILGTNTVAEKSAGLGLYIAKHFMEMQGGSISVQSVEGKGTTFTYRIPLAQDL